MVGTDWKSRRITLAHDWLVSLRGGEWVLDRLARQFGPTVIHTLVANGTSITPAIDACTIRTSILQRFPAGSGRLRRAYLPLMPRAVSRIRVEPCDLLISTSSAVMKSITPPTGTPHLCYCHSPARYIWEQGDEYAHGRGGLIRRLGLNAVRNRFKNWDRATADRVTHFLANSSHTADRIQRCYGREAEVVYPPVRTDFFTPAASPDREPWFLVVSALEPYKRTDLVIDAATSLGVKLKIAGFGSQEAALRAKAGPNIEFLGRVSDEQLRDLYRSARALVFPQQEDFGIVAVEAQACGCPVVAFRAGGATESVTSETGVFFEKQSVKSLAEAMDAMADRTIDDTTCRANAERFSAEVFDHAIAEQARRLLGESS